MASYYTDLDEDLGADEWAAEEERKERREANESMLGDMRSRYAVARRAEMGATIECPCCKKRIVKRTYHRVFCSNQKTHGRKNCKDRYWNMVDDKRRDRARAYA
jgi:hypothetical protein